MPKTKHTKDRIEDIIYRFGNSEKLVDLFDEFGIDRSTFNRKVKEFELHTMYVQAREDHGDGFNDEIETVKRDLRDGKIDAATARALFDTIKWQAGKFYPKMYGDKQTREHTGLDGAPIQTQQTVIFKDFSDEADS